MKDKVTQIFRLEYTNVRIDIRCRHQPIFVCCSFTLTLSLSILLFLSVLVSECVSTVYSLTRDDQEKIKKKIRKNNTNAWATVSWCWIAYRTHRSHSMYSTWYVLRFWCLRVYFISNGRDVLLRTLKSIIFLVFSLFGIRFYVSSRTLHPIWLCALSLSLSPSLVLCLSHRSHFSALTIYVCIGKRVSIYTNREMSIVYAGCRLYVKQR